jgi:hypothetical protein
VLLSFGSEFDMIREDLFHRSKIMT